MPEIGLAIGGFRATVVTRQTPVIDALRRRYADFLARDSGDWLLHIDVEPRPHGPGESVVVERDGAPDSFDVSRYDFAGRVDLARRVANVTVAEAHELTLDSLLRVILSLVLPADHGLLVHAASVVRGGRGYLFPGVSGAGK